MNYTDQIEVIKDLGLDEGQSIRMDCPFCMRKHTFSISKEDSKVLWYCFSASCDAKGAYYTCLLYTSPSPRDGLLSRMPSSA